MPNSKRRYNPNIRIFPKPGEAKLSRKRFREDRPQHSNLDPSPVGELLGLLMEPGVLKGKPLKGVPTVEDEEQRQAAEKAADRRKREAREIADSVWRKYGIATDLPAPRVHSGRPCRLESGWGVVTHTPDVRLGDIVKITPRTPGVEPWCAEVIEIQSKGERSAIVRTGTPGVTAKVEIRKRLRMLDAELEGRAAGTADARRKKARKRPKPRPPKGEDRPWGR